MSMNMEVIKLLKLIVVIQTFLRYFDILSALDIHYYSYIL
jgi:hypothetical protein